MEGTANEKRIEERVHGILVEMFEIDPAQLKPQASLRGTLRLDSADLVDLVTRLEKDFGLNPELDGYRNVNTVKELVGFVAAEMTKSGAG
jgi:acyl carrier protein